MTTSLEGIAGDLGDVGWYEEAEEDFVVDPLEGRCSMAIPGGGSSKDICREEDLEPSCPRISVEEAGVGGCSGRGISRRRWWVVVQAGLVLAVYWCYGRMRLYVLPGMARGRKRKTRRDSSRKSLRCCF